MKSKGGKSVTVKTRTVAVLFSVLLIFICPALGRVDPNVPKKQLLLEAEYINNIRPKVVKTDKDPNSLITTGKVILYGQLISPPYRLAISKDRLLLNGVQTDPSIIPPWYQQTEQISVTDSVKSLSDATTRIVTKHEELKKQRRAMLRSQAKPEEDTDDTIVKTKDLQTEISRYITQKEKNVKAARWENEKTLHILMSDGKDFFITFDDDIPKQDTKKETRELLTHSKQLYEARLREGGLVIIGFGEVQTFQKQRAAKVLGQINKALKGNSADRLKKALHSEELAREMLFVRKQTEHKTEYLKRKSKK